MAYRSRTADFLRLRDEHSMRRGGKFKDYSSKKTLLDAQDVEMREHVVYLPPDWVARVSDIQYEITGIRSKCKCILHLPFIITTFIHIHSIPFIVCITIYNVITWRYCHSYNLRIFKFTSPVISNMLVDWALTQYTQSCTHLYPTLLIFSLNYSGWSIAIA